MFKLKSVAFSLALLMLLPTYGFAKTMYVCTEGSPEGFDPARYTSNTTYDASSKPIYSRLVERKRGTTEIVPGIAERWDVSEDGLEYTFFLRRDVQFHTTRYYRPSRALNADDVLFSFERQLRADHPWYRYEPNVSWPFFDGLGLSSLIDRVERIDDHTVRFVLTKPDGTFLTNMALDFASIMSAEYATRLENEGQLEVLNQLPIGTGPFQLVEFLSGTVVRLAAHDAYWQGRQPIDDLVFSIETDPAVRLQKLRADECQVATYPTPTDFLSAVQKGEITIHSMPSLNIGYLAFNTRVAPFDDKEVRKAINAAINKKAIIAKVFGGNAELANGPLPPTIAAHNNDIANDVFDFARANEILEAKGMVGAQVEIWALPFQRLYNPNPHLMAEMLSQDLARAGIDTRIVSYEWGDYLKRSKEMGRKGLVLLGWTSDNGDPDNFFSNLLACDRVRGSNRAQWCNEEFDALVRQAKVTSDPAKRRELYGKAQEIFADEMPWVPIAHSMDYVAVSNKVTGFEMDPLGGHWFDGVDLN